MSRDEKLVQRTWLSMLDLAGRMMGLRLVDPVRHADMATSMSDRRCLLTLARGISAERINRDGYEIRDC